MAKERFKIPTTLDRNYFDIEFSLKTKNGVGFEKPVTAKVIVSSILAAFGLVYIVFQSFISKGGIPVIIGFSIAWIAMTGILIKSDKTKRMGLELIISAMNYIPRSGRHVATRMTDIIGPLQRLYNMKGIDEEDGRIYYLDGSIGYVYHIVGSASALMFEGDKNTIINKVDSFYKKLAVDVDVIFDTVYEGHDVTDQIASVRQDIANLNSNSPGLRALLREEHDILDVAINQQSTLTSLHQYLVVKANDEQDLQSFENLLFGDVQHDGLMFRVARPLGFDESVRYFRKVLNGL